jgi:hypothetical protein
MHEIAGGQPNGHFTINVKSAEKRYHKQAVAIYVSIRDADNHSPTRQMRIEYRLGE